MKAKNSEDVVGGDIGPWKESVFDDGRCTNYRSKVKHKLTYINASTEDSKLLTETAMTSKRIWGYSDDLMELWKSDLEISHQYILDNKVVKIFDHEIFIGFFAIKLAENNIAEIDHLWLTPDKMKRGYGRLIFQYIFEYLKKNGHGSATLIAEPNAKGFYDKMNGKVIGQFQSKVSGRFLDIYNFNLLP